MDPSEPRNLLEVPGGSQRGSVSSSVTRYPEVLVYLVNDSVIQISVESLTALTAGELARTVREALQLPDQAQEIFSLWLVSPFLELQLKPKHHPYKVSRQWSDLLYRFTKCSVDDIVHDEPSLQFRKNVFFPKGKELQIADEGILRLLYEEAKLNILEGRYPYDMEDCLKLGALTCRIELGPFNQDQHNLTVIREKLDMFLPTHLCKKHSGFLAAFRPRGAKQHCYEEELLESFRQLVDDAAREEPEALKLHYRAYLEKCHLLQYYGSAMFSGEIDKPVQSFLHRNGRKLVTIAISLDGVSVMDSKEKCVLLALGFHELSWEYTSSEDEESDDILWLEFDGEEGGAVVNKLLKIYSKQAELMSGMIDYCIDFSNTFEAPPAQDAVAAKPPRPKEKRGKLKRQNSVVCNRIQQLSTIDYVEEGKEIKRVKPKRAASFFTRQLSQGPASYTAVEVTETLEQG
ncbi:FERM domain-containing protein 8 [Stegostoma tigrinum]|uniref:FERM domain-containing protein 8 n=1 Tax=Stegostoma tigrinum TaxID=3053191 RepID=UPI0028702086|nr:FERM domain-containing protein 8 [Stegostoma tigrinum]XP_059497566.1 FERM domain-containing protein 8 [Stegostoma tigrinum]